MNTTTHIHRKTQVYFIAFPGLKQAFPPRYEGDTSGIPLIAGAPSFDADPNNFDDEEHWQDEAMRMADWALEVAPALFGLTDLSYDDYEGYNDKSIDLAEQIFETMEGHTRVEYDPQEHRSTMWRWTQDTELAPGVIVRAARFEWEAQR